MNWQSVMIFFSKVRWSSWPCHDAFDFIHLFSVNWLICSTSNLFLTQHMHQTNLKTLHKFWRCPLHRWMEGNEPFLQRKNHRWMIKFTNVWAGIKYTGIAAWMPPWNSGSNIHTHTHEQNRGILHAHKLYDLNVLWRGQIIYIFHSWLHFYWLLQVTISALHMILHENKCVLMSTIDRQVNT